MSALIGVMAVLVLAVLYRRVAREERLMDQTATPEMWARSLSYYNENRRPGALRAPRTGGSTT